MRGQPFAYGSSEMHLFWCHCSRSKEKLRAFFRAAAHPFSQGALDVVVDEHSITVHARVAVEEVAVTKGAAKYTGNRSARGL